MREMTDSGIEWIGKIPSDWTVSKITHILDLTHPYAIGDGDHGIIKADDYTDDGIPYIRVNNLGWATELQLSNVVYITQQQNELIKSSTLKPDDILFAKTGATIGKTAIIPKSVAIANTTSHVGKISVSREHCAKFFYYVLSSYIGYKQFWDFASLKTTRPELSIDEIKQTILISPTSYAEQKAISDHLDLKCKECDTLVIDIQSQIEALEEYKRSVITEAVTKGLDPDVEMRDSGVQWIGEIPTHWTLIRIGSLYGLRTQKVSDIDYPPLSVTKMGVLPQLDTVAKTNAHDDRKLVVKGDFVINSRSDRRGSCGISDYTGSVSLINTVLFPITEMNPRYYNWYFHTVGFADEFYRWGHGIVDDLWTTGWQNMKNILISVPPLDEQQRIADYLDSKCAEIDNIITEKKQQIETIEEYKKSLIFEYVTGKKEVQA